MAGDKIDGIVSTLAKNYLSYLKSAQAEANSKPASRLSAANAGTNADKRLAKDILRQGATMMSCRTGVDTGRGGQSRFDAVFNLAGTRIYLEVQAREYHGHKPVQAQGQLIGFAEVDSSKAPARYYKIIGEPREIHCWTSRAQAQVDLAKGNYLPQKKLRYR